MSWKFIIFVLDILLTNEVREIRCLKLHTSTSTESFSGPMGVTQTTRPRYSGKTRVFRPFTVQSGHLSVNMICNKNNYSDRTMKLKSLLMSALSVAAVISCAEPQVTMLDFIIRASIVIGWIVVMLIDAIQRHKEKCEHKRMFEEWHKKHSVP